MKLPCGRLLRSRVVDDPRTVLAGALDRELTGYAVLEPQDALLLDADGKGVVTFSGGVPVVAYYTGTDRGGPRALADLAATGPYRLELFALEPRELSDVHEQSSFRVPAGMPAERLAGDQALADRTRAAVPSDSSTATVGSTDSTDADGATGEGRPQHSGGNTERSDRQAGAVEAFLDDEEKIETIREQARAEALERAEEWGF